MSRPQRAAAATRGEALLQRYRDVRSCTECLCAPLEREDYVVQSMPDASPVKWHLAHTTWFFETFLLVPSLPGYRRLEPMYEVLFNSYYNSVGEQYPRPQRGMLTRPTVDEVYAYRRHVDEAMLGWLERESAGSPRLEVVELGLHHEQQHQELLLTDLKHLLSQNPLRPAYGAVIGDATDGVPAPDWRSFAGGVVEVGHAGGEFAFDNETPRHRVLLEPFQLATRLVTNAEYLEFIENGGYRRPDLWLSEGWETVRTQGWSKPLYWEGESGERRLFTLAGMRDLIPDEPVCHVSYFEADAYARWAQARLPREEEWEIAAAEVEFSGNFVESGHLHPAPARGSDSLLQLFGDVWQWTQSPYVAYPAYRPPSGALGEYNGKFMCNQLVLRGASCATPRSHARATYRNFFPAAARWQFSGIRLARDPQCG